MQSKELFSPNTNIEGKPDSHSGTKSPQTQINYSADDSSFSFTSATVESLFGDKEVHFRLGRMSTQVKLKLHNMTLRGKQAPHKVFIF